MAGAVRGKDFKLYRNTSTTTTPAWAEVVNVKDVTRNLEKALADASIRGTSFRQQVGTLKDLSIDFQMVYNNGDADLLAFEAAFYSDANIGVLCLDGPISTVGSAGIQFTSQVTKFGQAEALEDVGLVDVTLVPGYDPTNPPTRVTVSTAGTVTPVP
jgi:hypothetical protein